MAETYPHVFSPLQVGSLTIPNRIVRAAHTTHQSLDEGTALTAYHVARARGGVGLSVLGSASVHPSATIEIAPYDEQVVGAYQRLVAGLAPYEMKVMQQLWHPGSAAHANSLGGPLWSSSDVPNPRQGRAPIPMTKDMIDDVVAGFATSARNVQLGGLDGVEIHAGHNYLVAQFLSPATNHRTDEYGGTEENRLRFLQEILAAVRAEVGREYPIGVRLSSDEDVPGGLTPQDTLRLARVIENQIDFLDLSFGGYYRFNRMMATGDGYGLGYELPSSAQVTRELTVPTMVTGRIMTIDHAEQIIASGTADMVSMVRALIADPDIVAKSRRGAEEQVRPCIGTNEGCVASRGPNFGCVVNPAAGNESTWALEPESVAKPRRILVGGGGPAGLEAARTAALRGHEVHLLELTSRLGGQVAIGASAPYRADFGAHVRWLEDEVRRLGVTVRLRTPIEPDVVSEIAPDVVIVATGSTPRRDGFSIARPLQRFSRAQQRRVATSWDVFGFGGGIGQPSRALVYDDVGDFEAISVVEALLEAAADVTLVTRRDTFGLAVPEPASTVQAARDRLLGQSAFALVTNAAIVDVDSAGAEIEWLGSSRRMRVVADTVVIVGTNQATTEVAEAISESFAGEIHVIGDAVVPGRLREAVWQGALIGRSV